MEDKKLDSDSEDENTFLSNVEQDVEIQTFKQLFFNIIITKNVAYELQEYLTSVQQ